MPTRRLPNTTPTVIRLLQTAHDEWKRTPNAPDRAISADQWAQLDDTVAANIFNRLLKANGDVGAAQAAQAPISASLALVAPRLGMFVSHFHQAFDNGVLRGTFAVGARSYYQRTVSATSIPDVSTYDAIAEAADNIVKGEAARALAEGHEVTFDSGVTYDSGVRFDSTTGYVPVMQPNAAEVGALLAQFKTLRDESNEVQKDLDKQREALQALMPDALALATDICDTVEFFYRKDPDASSRRAKCERWGVVYIYDDTTTPPATTTTTPPAAPAATSTTPKP